MSTLMQDCVNYELNIQVCPCTNEGCDKRGICCECIQASYVAGEAAACMRGVPRRPETMALSQQAVAQCATNQTRNTEFCVCTSDTCARRGVCCNCVRNHFTLDGTGRTACMKAFG